MPPYGYIEYPKCLYNKDGLTMEVQSAEEEARMAPLGWMTAEQFHAPSIETPKKKSKA